MSWLCVKSPIPHLQCFCRDTADGRLIVLFGNEPPGFHMSISHPKRYPTWDEIKGARYKFCPDEYNMALLLPPRSEYVNVHKNCFHLYEVPSV